MSPDMDLAARSLTDPALTVTAPDTDDAFNRPDTASTSISPDTEPSATDPLRYVAVTVPDTVFTFANARSLYEAAGSADKTLLAWDDGDHCLYNHAQEKNCTVADFFSDRLRR